MAERKRRKNPEPEITVEEAVRRIITESCCGAKGGCTGCYLEGNCTDKRIGATRLLADKFADGDRGRLRDEIVGKLRITVSLEDAERPPSQISPKDRKCTNCQHKKLLDGGYLFCTKFHNTTIPEGYCHNYEEVSDHEEETR